MKKVAKYKLFNSKLTSAISISMVLFLLACIIIIGIFAKQLSSYVLENITLTVFMNESAEENDIQELDSYLKKQPYTKYVVYISKEAGIKTLCDEIGENPDNFKVHNPLPDIFELNLKAEYANNDSILLLAKSLESFESVKGLDYQKTMTHLIVKKIKKIAVMLLCATAILLLMSFVLINNTIRLLIHSDRFIIHTMRLVGATKHFIRKPYVKQGMLIGLSAFLLTSFYIVGLGYLFFGEISEYLPDIRLYPLPYIITFGSLLFFSIIIPVIAAVFSVNKYLRRTLDDLYYI